MLASLVNKQQARPFISTCKQADGLAPKALIEQGKVSPLIDKVLPLDDGVAAVAHVASGHAQGKSVITM